ncbi:MFS transporter [Amaricoccus macauensis]|uniref:MFS transporter n=1 Tax=Amaricoccus macauensis TaxID=57001 RepID=UPI003C7E08C5
MEHGPGPGIGRNKEGHAITHFWTLSAAGFAATAISFGPARMGFGLFASEFRSEFSMSTSAIGVVSSLGFLGFFIGLLIAPPLLARKGPEAPVLCGLLAATLGMAIVASAPNLPVLAAGVFLAASSAGFAWTPFNSAAHRTLTDRDRPAALSAISTGTGIGIAGAGLAALAVVFTGFSWRAGWALFAGASALAFLGNRAAMHRVGSPPAGRTGREWKALLQRDTLPLYAIGVCYGVTSAVYISFAADHMTEAGGVPGLPQTATPALIFICYGLIGLVGAFSGQARAVLGLPMLLRLLLLAGAISIAPVALAPSSWSGLIASAGLQGVHVMMTSAVLAFWSDRLFPALPSLGFTAALLAVAVGSVVGPALAGLVADSLGSQAMLLGTAILPAATAAALRDRHATDRPVSGPASDHA